MAKMQIIASATFIPSLLCKKKVHGILYCYIPSSKQIHTIPSFARDNFPSN